MKITKERLKEIIKEELQVVLGESMMDRATELQQMLGTIAYWMEENRVYSPKEGVERWVALARKNNEPVSPETKQALLDMSDEIYNYM